MVPFFESKTSSEAATKMAQLKVWMFELGVDPQIVIELGR